MVKEFVTPTALSVTTCNLAFIECISKDTDMSKNNLRFVKTIKFYSLLPSLCVHTLCTEISPACTEPIVFNHNSSLFIVYLEPIVWV